MVDDRIGADQWTGLVWLRDTEENAAWYKALVAIDRRGDKEPLIELLKSGQPVPPSIAFFVGDLLERYQLKYKSRPRTPAYTRTPEQIKLIAALIQVLMRVEDGILPTEALQDVAAENGLKENTLTNAYSGKHGGLRRARRLWFSPAHKS